MKNNIKALRKARDWSQEVMADRVNEVLAAHPHLKKKTKKNPEGWQDQKTVQRVEAGGIGLDQRWLEIFKLVFNVSSSEILGEEAPLPAISDDLTADQRKAMEAMLEAFRKQT